jgi:hypothetical protein
MPSFDGTGPLGQGPMTGRGQGFCILTKSKNYPGRLEGSAGLQGIPISQNVNNFENTGKEVINMPRGDGTSPAGLGPMTGRAAGFCAGYPVLGYMNPVAGRTGFYGPVTPAVRPYGAASYGYGIPYGIGVNPWLSRGFGFGRGFGRGRGRGRGRFRFWW